MVHIPEMPSDIATPRELPGPHHCIGTARAVVDIVFRSLRARCAALGGVLPQDELDALCSEIVDSFACGFDLFELRHNRCMNASLSTSDMPFARERILATLLRACAEKSARGIFSLQIQHLGARWIDQLFEGIASYARHHIGTRLDAPLINAYVDTANIPGIKLTPIELLKRQAVKDTISECARVFETAGGSVTGVNDACDWVNASIAKQRNAGGADISKITQDEARSLLFMLPQEISFALATTPVSEI